MNNGDFQKEVIERLSNLESDVSFIKGVIEGRDYRSKQNRDRVSTYVAFISLGVSILLVASRILGW